VSKYVKMEDGQVRVLRGRRGAIPHKVMCCDCGLVHRIAYRLTGPSTLEFVAWRDKRATAAARRRKR
jgi:hypothetical protein